MTEVPIMQPGASEPLYEPSPLILFHDFEANSSETQLSEWPLHLTVVPFFKHDIVPLDEVIDAVEWINYTSGSFPIELGGVALYGPKRDIPVTKIIDQTGALVEYHHALVRILGEIGCKFIDLTYAGEYYSPHITHQEPKRLPPSPYTVNTISLATRLPGTAQPNKEIVKHIPMAGLVDNRPKRPNP